MLFSVIVQYMTEYLVGVGKTSLISALMKERFDQDALPSKLPEVTIPSKYNPDNVNVVISDTLGTLYCSYSERQ